MSGRGAYKRALTQLVEEAEPSPPPEAAPAAVQVAAPAAAVAERGRAGAARGVTAPATVIGFLMDAVANLSDDEPPDAASVTWYNLPYLHWGGAVPLRELRCALAIAVISAALGGCTKGPQMEWSKPGRLCARRTSVPRLRLECTSLLASCPARYRPRVNLGRRSCSAKQAA